MNILFITIENYINFEGRSIYLDLINEFISNGHFVTVLSACENRDRREESLDYYSMGKSGEIIKVNIPDITKVSNFVLKGINLIRTIPIFKNSAKKAIKNREYDLVVYNSPPITIYSAVDYVKRTQGAKSYLLLKDIWPYDCLFGGVLSLKGWKHIAFDFLALLARKLYKVSDVIGCMSPANIQFLMENEPRLERSKIEICPNTITPFKVNMTIEDKMVLRGKYNIPLDKTVFVYGGNLGVPQGIDFAIESIKVCEDISNAFFVFVGGGTERKKLDDLSQMKNFLLLPPMAKDEYETLVFACDVGMIYLNHDCLAPNYPSRLLSYMQAGIPVICATDTYTDIGRIAVDNGYGLWCESNDLVIFKKNVESMCIEELRKSMGRKSYNFLLNNYTSKQSYEIIMRQFN